MPQFGEFSRDTQVAIEPGTYKMTFIKFGEPALSNFKSEKTGEPIMQIKAFYVFDNGQEYSEYLSTSCFDGAGGKYPASRLFLRLRGLMGVKDRKEAEALRSEDIQNIPCIGLFSENSRGKVALAQVKRDNTRQAPKPKPINTDPVDPLIDFTVDHEPLPLDEEDINSVPF
jgi:hypothetical protein